MKTAALNIILTMTKLIQVVVGVYLILAVALYLLNQVRPIAPLSVHDFVVNKDHKIIIASDHDERIFVYSKNMKLVNTFKIPEEVSAPLLAIDVNNMIYMLKGNTVYQYDVNGDEIRIEKARLDLPRNWRLTNDGMIVNFQNHKESEKVFSTLRLRRIAKLGDILFLDSRIPYNSIKDSFVDDEGNKYVSEEWFSGIRIISPTGKVLGGLTPPLLIRIFIMPYPGVYLIIIGAFLLVISVWISRKMKQPGQNNA